MKQKNKYILISVISSIALFWVLFSHHSDQKELRTDLYTHLSNGVNADSDIISLIQNDLAMGFIVTTALTVGMSALIAWSFNNSVLQPLNKSYASKSAIFCCILLMSAIFSKILNLLNPTPIWTFQ